MCSIREIFQLFYSPIAFVLVVDHFEKKLSFRTWVLAMKLDITKVLRSEFFFSLNVFSFGISWKKSRKLRAILNILYPKSNRSKRNCIFFLNDHRLINYVSGKSFSAYTRVIIVVDFIVGKVKLRRFLKLNKHHQRTFFTSHQFSV